VQFSASSQPGSSLPFCNPVHPSDRSADRGQTGSCDWRAHKSGQPPVQGELQQSGKDGVVQMEWFSGEMKCGVVEVCCGGGNVGANTGCWPASVCRKLHRGPVLTAHSTGHRCHSSRDTEWHPRVRGFPFRPASRPRGGGGDCRTSSPAKPRIGLPGCPAPPRGLRSG